MKTLLYPVRMVTALMATILWCSCDDIPVIYPQKKDIIETVYASGMIISENEYKQSALSNGTIIKKLVSDGDTVKKGQLLYIISNEAATERFEAALQNYTIAVANLSDQSPLLNDLQLSIRNAGVKSRNDSATWYRWKNLWTQNIGTKSNLDNVYSNYLVSLNQQKIAEQKYYSTLNEMQVLRNNARSQLTAARKALHECFIRSNRNGIVYQTFKEPGEVVFSNEVVALLGGNRERVIRLAVDQQDIDKIKPGQPVLLQGDVTGNTIYQAVITKIYPVMNELDQTFRVDAHFTELPVQSFTHSSVEANIIVQTKNKALVLPRHVLSDKDSVWVRTKGKEKKTAVRTGISTLDYVEILSGVDEKTPVLLNTKNKAP